MSRDPRTPVHHPPPPAHVGRCCRVCWMPFIAARDWKLISAALRADGHEELAERIDAVMPAQGALLSPAEGL